MKNILKILIPLLVLVASVYQFRAPLSTQFAPLLSKIESRIHPPVPCAEPIPYNLGTFDTQFGISKSYFLSALADAEAIWEKPYGKQLFTYTPADTGADVLKVNLIYDYRQQATSKLSSLGITVEDNRSSYDMLKVKFDSLKAQYDINKTAFNTQVASFNQRQQAYETQVQYWNARNGAPQAEFNKLEATRLELVAESKQIQVLQNNLNAQADEINALVVALNRLINTLNLSVDKYNTTNVSRGETFEEGLYVSDGINKEIDIYEFSNRDKLVRVLAHELGHALGLEHVDDPKAIMYKLNQGTNTALTATDLAALKAHCGTK
ncbi:MAG: matrixin family metalloprotease [Patescibacteria group bacterium]|nr:matrixin family metalloprotease [Patescibacteria group bacterium]